MAIVENQNTIRIRNGAYSDNYYILGIMEGFAAGTADDLYFEVMPKIERGHFLVDFYESPDGDNYPIVRYNSKHNGKLSLLPLGAELWVEPFAPRRILVKHKLSAEPNAKRHARYEWMRDDARKFALVGKAINSLYEMETEGYLDRVREHIEFLYDEWERGMKDRGIEITIITSHDKTFD